MDLTLAAALLAGLLSFFSPCCLPVVPAYLGQLGVVVARSPALATAMAAGGALSPATAGASAGMVPPPPPTSTSTRPSWGVAGGWRTLPNAIAFVVGFGLVFTILGLTAYVAAGPLRANLPLLRQIGGVVLVILGLNLMGVLRLSRLARSWRPLDTFVNRRPGAERKGVLGGLTLGAIFAIGWTPCIGPTLGAILTLSALGNAAPQVAALLVAYSLGLGIPFIVLALAVDRAPAITGPLVRHGRTIELVGGALVVVIGVALWFDWLSLFAQRLSFLWPRV